MTFVRLAAAAALLFMTSTGRAQLDDDAAREREQADLQRMRERAAGPQRTSTRFAAAPKHDGFYFRADSGVGYLKMTLPLASEASYGGVGILSGLHVGGAVQDKALLGVQLWAATAQSATLSPSPARGSSDATTGQLGLGPELTVYFLPSNAYITAAAGVTWLTVKNDSGSDTSKPGLGGRVAVGTEWWLAPRWGLGAAVSGSYSANKFNAPELGGSLPFTAWTLGLSLSVTYN